MKILINALIKLILNIESFFPISSLEELANDEDWYVRSYVAKHPNCPQYLKDYIRMKKFVRTYGKNS